MSADALIAAFRARLPLLADREDQMWFDAYGRQIAAESHAFGSGQTKAHFQQFAAHLTGPENTPVPDGYTAPFYKADREKEMR
ncbi:hypothetical protein, partial [Streptomyces sp. EL9]|uniref:hypothetical protein n=1 Tax=Streptomyces sp. EL9 TaxID=2841666 RepID=UPI002095CFDD